MTVCTTNQLPLINHQQLQTTQDGVTSAIETTMQLEQGAKCTTLTFSSVRKEVLQVLRQLYEYICEGIHRVFLDVFAMEPSSQHHTALSTIQQCTQNAGLIDISVSLNTQLDSQRGLLKSSKGSIHLCNFSVYSCTHSATRWYHRAKIRKSFAHSILSFPTSRWSSNIATIGHSRPLANCFCLRETDR